MAVIAYFVDKNYKIQTKLLTLRRLIGEHFGENQIELLINILKDYDFTDKIEYFVIDNTSNNIIIIDVLFRDIQFSFFFQRVYRRLRY
jgi:hypothetical protein